jgi:SAM-dependent methyltransferase
MPEQKMYDELAAWWPLLSAPEDYVEEAGFYTELLREVCNPTSVLELGSGGGNNATHMKRHFELTLVDRSASMLQVSKALNPDCEHIVGDMRDVRLGREFDAVFIHDAVMYMATRQDLLMALETAAVHCRAGGAVLIAPDCTAETWSPGTDHGGHDGDGRALRYLEWTHDDDPDDEQDEVDFVFVLRENGKPARVVHERHIYGVFAENTWIELCRQAGLDARKSVVNHTGVGEHPVFVCRKI